LRLIGDQRPHLPTKQPQVSIAAKVGNEPNLRFSAPRPNVRKAVTVLSCSGGTKVQFKKLYSDAQGESHWKDVDVDLEEQTFAPPAKAIEISKPEAVTQTMFLRLRTGWDEPIHPTPVAQKLICLSGSVPVTASDGEFRDIGPGDVWHMEDKQGKGHHTVVTNDEDFLSVIIQYE